MKKIKTTTGYGIIKDQDGNVICKCELLKDKEHPIKDGYSFEEVTTKDELDSITVVHNPTEEEILEKKIRDEMRLIAIESLKAKNEI